MSMSARPHGHARNRIVASLLGAGMVFALAACSSQTEQPTSHPPTTIAVGSSTVTSADPTQSSKISAPSTPGQSTPVATSAQPTAEPEPAARAIDNTPGTSLIATTAPATTVGSGNVNEIVAVADLPTQPPVNLDGQGDFGNAVTVDLIDRQSIATNAQLPGEIAGPGIALTFIITNGSDAAIDLGAVAVDVQDSNETPAIAMTGAPAAPFSGELAAGGTATGVYVVTLPIGHAGPLSILVSYSSQASVVVFTGAGR